MTDTLSLNEIETQLAAAYADLALYERLTGAADRVKRLTAINDKAVTAREKAEAGKTAAAQEARFAGLSNLSIAETAAPSGIVIRSRFIIRYTRNAWNSDAGATLPTEETKEGFAALEPNVLAWIAQRHPEKIPASIMALAPGNVDAALDTYFAGLRRGYLKA